MGTPIRPFFGSEPDRRTSRHARPGGTQPTHGAMIATLPTPWHLQPTAPGSRPGRTVLGLKLPKAMAPTPNPTRSAQAPDRRLQRRGGVRSGSGASGSGWPIPRKMKRNGRIQTIPNPT